VDYREESLSQFKEYGQQEALNICSSLRTREKKVKKTIQKMTVILKQASEYSMDCRRRRRKKVRQLNTFPI
jgi:hypothetical protein